MLQYLAIALTLLLGTLGLTVVTGGRLSLIGLLALTACSYAGAAIVMLFC